MREGQNFYYVKISTKGTIEYKLLGNKKGVLTFIHEHLQKHYLEYEEIKNEIGNYQKFKKNTQNINNSFYEKQILETYIIVQNIKASYNYKGEDKEQKIYKSINR